ncbi:MAG: hypothetical protein JWO35_892 [Candidatus Saccharibacteria bacterium]|nr:hypothetical protein [Candidatus Saccharibacteria bacterium]
MSKRNTGIARINRAVPQPQTNAYPGDAYPSHAVSVEVAATELAAGAAVAAAVLAGSALLVHKVAKGI